MIGYRLRTRGDDNGFALILALFITTFVMVGLTMVLRIVTPNITTSKRGQDVVAAQAAARSGIDDLVAYLVGIPSCRSESRICPAALGASSAALAASGSPRPSLGNGQSFSWTTNSATTTSGFVRVTSVGTSGTVSRTLVADLALRPSILGYGYYTDYEATLPKFLKSFYKPRNIYLTDCTGSSVTCDASSPKYANWAGPSNTGICGQHWYAEGSIPGRAAATNPGAPINEAGTVGTTTTNGSAVTRTQGCDLVFSPAMSQNGKTFTRDAILSTSTGPKFNQPVYTMWGYKDGTKDFTNPAFSPSTRYYRVQSGGSALNSPYVPQIADADLTLPPNIGKDGIPENACVYTGPTRVKLNGDGTATVTSPTTRVKSAASDSACYPADVSAGVVGWKYNYGTTGGGAIVTRNSGTAPSTGWPTNPTKSTQTPSASNELFYFNAPGSTDVTQHPDKSAAAYAGCSNTVKYSAAVDASCAWSTVGVITEGSSALGWTDYTKTACSSATPTNRQLFECEYVNAAGTASPALAQSAGNYKAVRDAVQTDLAKSTCLTGTTAAQVSCVNAIVQAKVNVANSSTTVSGSHRYVATSAEGSTVTSTATGNTGAGPDGTTADSFFTQPTPAKETASQTPITTTVKRQVYNASSKTWGTDAVAFTLTTTQSSYAYTPARGYSYFPNENDVTGYNVGADSAGSQRGTGVTPQTGDRQPGDLYIDGKNKGKLSVLADNDVIITGDITNPTGYSPDTDAVSITGGVNVRNYHPVKCVDQTAADINNTTSGWCPNDLTGLVSNNAYPSINDYTNMAATGDRVIQAAVFALSGSFGTDNYTRAGPVGNLNIQGGLYQSSRGGNGVVNGSTSLAGTTLQYTYVDLQRAELPYVPPSTSGNDVRPWNVVSISAG